MPPDPAELDARLDTLGLLESVHAQDTEAVQVILNHADVRLVAVFACRIACDLIEDWLLDDEPDMFGRLRRHYS